MTRSYQEARYDMQHGCWEIVANWSFTVYPGDNEHLTVSRNGEVKTVRVQSSNDNIYGLYRTKVLAMGGAHGLFGFMDKELFADNLSTFAWKVLRHCFFDCKAA